MVEQLIIKCLGQRDFLWNRSSSCIPSSEWSVRNPDTGCRHQPTTVWRKPLCTGQLLWKKQCIIGP